jgi:hypothetical protein
MFNHQLFGSFPAAGRCAGVQISEERGRERDHGIILPETPHPPLPPGEGVLAAALCAAADLRTFLHPTTY